LAKGTGSCDSIRLLGHIASVYFGEKFSRVTLFTIGATLSGSCFERVKHLIQNANSFHVINNGLLNDMLLVSSCRDWKCLLSFHVRRCELITSIGVVAVCNACPQLEDVVLDGSGMLCRIGDAALVNGIASLKHLRHLTLFELPYVSPAGFGEVVLKCFKLSDVKVSGCVDLDSSSIAVILATKKVLNSCLFGN
jgi:hypothetical protein